VRSLWQFAWASTGACIGSAGCWSACAPVTDGDDKMGDAEKEANSKENSDSGSVKSVRFSTVVDTCGTPETHLPLMDPAKDRAFQALVKSQRVMTVFQATAGTKADHGEVGFLPGTSRQFLLFPKSLRKFAGASVVGIKYDLLESAEVDVSEVPAERPKTKPPPNKFERKKPKIKESHPPKQKTKPKPVRKPKARPTLRRTYQKKKASAPSISSKIVPFEPQGEMDGDHEIDKIKKAVKHAMKVLEEGKAVAAYNLLKDIVES
jgi:hypothetical protein